MNEACDIQQPKADRRLAPVTCLAYTVGDIIRVWHGTRYGVWKITGMHLGAISQENLVSLKCLNEKPGCAFGKTGDSVMPYDLLITHPHVERV